MALADLARASARHLPEPLRRVAHGFRVRHLIRSYPERIVSHTYGHGVKLRISIQDPVAEGWYDHDEAGASAEIDGAREYGLSTGARVFDIGAHQGVVALVLADIVGPSGQVIAVEAARHNIRVAARNVALNDCAQVQVVHAACAQTPGTVAFHEDLNGHVATGRLGTRRTRAVTVDSLADLYGVPDVVYLDIEGHEERAVLGATRTLTAGATFVIEVHAGGELQSAGGSVPSLVSLLRQHGYGLHYCREGAKTLELFPGDAVASLDRRFFLLASRSISETRLGARRRPGAADSRGAGR